MTKKWNGHRLNRKRSEHNEKQRHGKFPAIPAKTGIQKA
jgi:hypothetical protein